MTTPIRVGQFGIIDHEPVEHSPNAGVFLGKGPASDRAEMYLVAEATTTAGESFAGHVLSSLGQVWMSLDMSLTGSLREVYKAAHANVRDWNSKSLVEHEVGLGLACLARRGEQTVVAVGGPSIVFHSSASGCTAHYPDEEHAGALGSEGSEPIIRRITLEQGDRLLMISSAALATIDPELLADILTLDPDRVLPEIYRRVANLRDVTVMLLVPGGESEPAVSSPAAPDLRATETVIDATNGSALQSANRRLAEEARRELEAIRRQAQIRVIVPGAHTIAPSPLRRVSGDATFGRTAPVGLAPARRPRNSVRRASFSRSLVRAATPPPPPPPTSEAPLVEDVARAVTERQGQRAINPSGAGAVPPSRSGNGSLVRVRGKPNGRMRSNGALSGRGRSAQPAVPWWAVAAGIVGVIIVAISVFTVRGLLESDPQEQYLALLDRAQTQIGEAQSAESPAVRREALSGALGLLQQASQAPEAGPEATEALTQVTQALAQMDAVTAPAAIETVGSLAEFGESPVTVSGLVIGTAHAYLLDTSANQVIAMAVADGTAQTVYSTSEAEGRIRPVAVTQDVAEGTDAVLIADGAAGLWSYAAATGLRPLEIDLPVAGSITDLATANGTLYVLDAANAAVYGYTATSGGFGERTTVASAATLADARKVTVDGDVILVTNADGSLHTFQSGLELDLTLGGIDASLTTAAAAVRLPASDEFAIADPARARVVVFRGDGSFVRQYQAPEFEAIAALAVSPAGSYVYSGGELRRITW